MARLTGARRKPPNRSSSPRSKRATVEMANGRTDEQDTPFGARASRCRIHVWGLFGETHLGQRSCSRVEGRTHDRTRSVSQIKQNPLRSRGRPHMHHANMRGLSEDNASWNTICTRRRMRRVSPAEMPVKSCPAMRTVPASGSIRRSARRARVDLPHPLSPTRPNVSPGASVRLAPATARSVRPAPRRAA